MRGQMEESGLGETEPDTEPTKSAARKPEPCVARFLRLLYGGGLWLLLGLLTIAYAANARFWLSEALSVWPAWFWLVGLLPLTLLGRVGGLRRAFWWLLGAQLVWAFCYSEGPLLFRLQAPVVRESGVERGRRLRVVSLNLGGATAWNARLVSVLKDYDADLYCLQEMPGPALGDGTAVLSRAFPDFHLLQNAECAVLGRYEMLAEPTDLGAWREQRVLLQTPHGPLRLLSVRMPLPALELNLLSRRARQTTKAAHDLRKRVFQRLGRASREASAGTPCILAGDFNTPARSTLLNPIRAHFTDAFRRKGHGWGNTMTHDFPVSRIDAIYVSRGIKVLDAEARPNGISDHRTVVANVLVRW